MGGGVGCDGQVFVDAHNPIDPMGQLDDQVFTPLLSTSP